ncbi:hypothetical protein N2152v2_005901 [Parachlorella kessleri]
MGSKQPTLSIAATAYAQQTGWRRGQELIDALPYVDALSPGEKQAVDKLIEEEGDEILENEMSRIDAGEKMVGMDTKRYNLDPPPPAKRNDYAAWRQALDNAYSQLEHQYNRLLNLELLLKFGPDTWRVQNDALAVSVKQLQEELVTTRRQIEGLNRRELAKLEEEYLGLVHKNMEIEAACRQIEREIDTTRATLGTPADGSTDGVADAATGAAAGIAGGEGQPKSSAEAAGPADSGEGQEVQHMEQQGEPAAEQEQAAPVGQAAEEAHDIAAGVGLTEQQQEEAGRAAAAADGPVVPAADDAMQE